MKKILLISFFVGGLMFFCSSSAFASYNIDGYLSDWGVNPFTDWTPWDSWVDYVEEDWTEPPPYVGYIGTGGYPLGGEPCDIEALYFDDDPNSIYLAMVTSYHFATDSGDIAIGFGCTGNYPYGIKIKDLDAYGHMYVPIKKLRAGESWTYTHDPNAGPVHLEPGVGEDIGLAEIYYWDATSAYNEPASTRETWVLEAKLDRLLFDNLAQEGNTIQFNHTMQCANDYIRLCGDFDSPIIPEPFSLSLLSLGMLGFAFVKGARRGTN